MLLPLVLQLAAIARPTSVFTEWSLVEQSPRAEHVTARADYRRADGPAAALPRVVQRGPRPSARTAGTGILLPVFVRGGEWCVTLPPGDRAALRVVAEVTRPIARPRAFRTAWPRFAEEGAPSRQLVVVPRALLDDVPAGWTCPQEPAAEVACVTRAARPEALVRRLPALPSPPWSRGLAAALTALALAAAYARREGRLERFAGAAGGATVGLATALALVGASVLGWGPAVALTVPAMTAAGALAARSGVGRAAGGAALAAVPLMAVAGVAVERVVVVALAGAVAAVVGLAARGTSGPS
jgi:hypothetical protein